MDRAVETLGQATPTLVRQLGVVSATALVVSNMIGTGIFTTTGFLAGDLGDPYLILVIWLVGAVVALCGAFCYSELGVNFPSSGGEYVYLSRAYGLTWGFMSGWISFFAGFSAPIAAAALAFSEYLGYFYPQLQQEHAAVIWESSYLTLRVGGAQYMAAAIIAVFTILNCVGVTRAAKVQNILTGTKLAVVLAFIFFGILVGTGDWSSFSQPAARTSTTPLASQFAISLFWVYFGYSGWNAATYVAEELRQPRRTLPIALALGTAVVALLYIGLNVTFIYGTGVESMKGVFAVGSLAASKLFGPEISGMFSALMAISILSTVNAMVTIGPRVYYAMARNGAFFGFARKVNPRFHTPIPAILCQGVCAILMTITPFPQLVVYIGFSLTFFTVLAVASLFLFRRRPNWERLPVVSFGWPLMPAVFVLVGVWMIVYGIMLQPVVSAAAILTIAAGAAAYHLAVKGRYSGEAA
ncbi:MAG: amino acid permease [Bryobacterales bacterium]|nr:amino acid permease [Bryobacterales bacterium]